MAIIKCKMCGGDVELAPDKTFGTCDYCGSTMTFPKVDDEQRAAAFNRGNHFRRIGEFDKALAVYERIVAEDDTDAEAHWCCALCRFGIEYVEDPATYEYIPTCHRASFDSILEDVDYLAAVEHSDGITRRQYQKDAAKIAEVQRGILATSQHEEPFDVFICYKETDDATHERTRDSLDAQEIYYQLTEKGYRVFFARITLEDKAGSEYEPYIFAALQSAKVMIALGSKPEHFNAVWVKNEWSRFLALMKKDRSKLLLPCYRGMDPYDLPEQLSVLQSYDMGKIGFMQDLIRGVEKVLRRDEPKPTAQPVVPPVVQTTGGPNVAALLDRANMALEDGEWDKAKEFFDQVLNMDARCAEAYLGLAMASGKCRSQNQLATVYIQLFSEWDNDRNIARARQFGDENMKKWLAELDEKLRVARGKKAEEDRIARERKAEQERIVREKKAEEERIAEEKRKEEWRIAREKLAPIRQKVLAYQNVIAAGHKHTVGLCQDGTVVATKYIGKQYHYSGQCNVSGWTDIVAVAAYGNRTVGLKSDGTVVAVGENEDGQCNVSHWTDIVAVAACYSYTVGLKSDGTVVAVGGNRFVRECNVSGWRDIVAIAASGSHTVGLRSDGTVVATGSDIRGVCRVSGWRDIVAIATGNYHTVGLKSNGTVVATEFTDRNNDCGQCDVSGWKDIVAIAVGVFHTVGLKSDGTVVAVGENEAGQCKVSKWKLRSMRDDENKYTVACAAQQAGTEEKLAEAAKHFAALNGYRDSTVRAKACQSAYQQLRRDRVKAELTAEKDRLAAELPTIKGLFAGSKKAKLEVRLAEIEAELAKL